MAKFNIVLFEPEIPANTGNIGRTCVATDTRLHLIEPLGFSIHEKAIKRAGLDYWKDLDVTTYLAYEDFLQKIMQLLLTSSSSTSIPLQDCYCQEEKILLSYCYSHSIETTFSSSSFLHLLFLFSSSKQDIEYFFTLQSSQQDTYSIQFTIFLYSSCISSQ